MTNQVRKGEKEINPTGGEQVLARENNMEGDERTNRSRASKSDSKQNDKYN